MNWDAVAAVGEVVGAIAVVVTLAFVTVQLRQSNQGQRFAAYQNYLNARSTFQEKLLDSDVNQTFLKVSFSPTSASPEELRNYHQVMHLSITYFEGSFRLWKEGLLSDADWNSNMVMLGEFRSTPAFRYWWPAANPFFGAEFIEAVNATPITETGLERFLRAIDDAATGGDES